MMTKLYSMPEEWVAKLRASRTLDCYPPDEAAATEIPIAALRPPVIGPQTRGFDEKRLRDVVDGLLNNSSMPAVVAIYERDGAVLLDGAHRYFACLAAGYRRIPVLFVPLDIAEAAYGYTQPES